MRRAAAAALVALSLASAARAGPIISGSFSSLASSGEFTIGQNTVNVAGTMVTGSFDISSAAGATAAGGFGPGAYLLAPGAVDLSFDILALNQVVNFTSAGTGENALVELSDNGTTQQVLIAPYFDNPHSLTTELLSGPEGSLFTSITDPASLHAGPGVSLDSPIDLAIWQEGSATLDVTSQSIAETGVAEPASLAILATGILGLLTSRRKWRSANTAA